MSTKTTLLAVLFSQFTITFAANPPKEDAPVDDVSKLEGLWQVTKFIDHSEQAAGGDEIKEMTFEFKGKSLTIRKDKGHVDQVMRYSLDPTSKPKAIDIDTEGKVSEGIYKLEGDALTICVVGGSRTGLAAKRPHKFQASNANKHSLFVLTKLKKAT